MKSQSLINLPLCWILITVIYLLLQMLLPFQLVFIPRFIGLFVPIGMFNLVASFVYDSPRLIPPFIIVFPLVLFTVFGGEAIIEELRAHTQFNHAHHTI